MSCIRLVVVMCLAISVAASACVTAGPRNDVRGTDAASRALQATSPSPVAMSHEVLFFSARDEEHGRELWRTDGTEGGTALVKDLWPGSRSGDPHGLAEHDSSLYFFADDGTGEHLWTSDGTAGGTVIIRRFHPRARFGVCGRDRTIADVAGTLYFAGADGRDGCQLWKSDGTQAGTELVAVIADPPLYGGSNPYGFTGLGGLVYFIADDQSLHGRALWRSDGTEVGTRMVSDPQRGRSPCCTAGNWIGPMVNFDRNLYFRSRGHRFGQELWRTDGTTAGTTPLKDISPGPRSSYPGWVVVFEGRLFFSARDGTSGEELWTSDGTADGTTMVRELRPDKGGSWPSWLAESGGLLYFAASDGASGSELWSTDGSGSATAMVTDINLGSQHSHPSHLVDVDDVLYFLADDGVHGDELWRSDGSADGTVLVHDLVQGIEGPKILSLLGAEDRLFFSADDAIHGRELWMSDGTSGGSTLVSDISIDATSSRPRELVLINVGEA